MCGRKWGGWGPSPSPASHLRVPEGAHRWDTSRLQELQPKPVCGGLALGSRAITLHLRPTSKS